jgi:hypothetical protein
MSKLPKMAGYIQIVFCDQENNQFVILGGIGVESALTLQARWDDIEASPLGENDPSCLIADKMDGNCDFTDDRYITARTAERLLGKPLSELIEEGRARALEDAVSNPKRVKRAAGNRERV